MATLTIRDFDDDLKDELRVRAARHGRSMEAEVRSILRSALTRPEPTSGLATQIHELFADAGGVELDIPPRTDMPRPVEFPE